MTLRRGLGVVRTHDLADVAPEDVIADRRPDLTRDRPPVLDGQIGDAPAGINHVRRNDRPCGAGVETQPAPTAVPFVGVVGEEGKVGEDLSQEHP